MFELEGKEASDYGQGLTELIKSCDSGIRPSSTVKAEDGDFYCSITVAADSCSA